jgi:hypothetical protein
MSTWTPGQQPQLAGHALSAEVIEALFKVRPSAMDLGARIAKKGCNKEGQLGIIPS